MFNVFIVLSNSDIDILLFVILGFISKFGKFKIEINSKGNIIINFIFYFLIIKNKFIKK